MIQSRILLFLLGVVSSWPMKAMSHSCEKIETQLRNRIALQGSLPPRFQLEDERKQFQIPGVSLATLKGSQIDCVRGYGLKQVGHSGEIKSDTLFQAGSVSKVVAALGALYLVSQGLLSLDDEINSYLKRWKIPENEFTKTRKVTLRLLLSHQAGFTVAGFPGYEPNFPIPSLLQVLSGIKPANTSRVEVDLPPGMTWKYSGGGFAVLQLLIEEITKEPFAKWMKKTILDPIGMAQSTFEMPLPKSVEAKVASGHGRDGKELSGRWRLYPEMAAAGLWSTPSDLVKVILFIGKTYQGDKNRAPFIHPSLIREMLTCQKTRSGFGVMIRNSTNADEFDFDHGGVNEGFITRWRGVIPKDNKEIKGYAIMVNSSLALGTFMSEIEASISDYELLPNSKIEKRVVFKKKVLDLKSFVGKYRHLSKNIQVTISKKNEELYFQDNGMVFPVKLYPKSEIAFFALMGADLIFTRNRKNNVQVRLKYPELDQEEILNKENS